MKARGKWLQGLLVVVLLTGFSVGLSHAQEKVTIAGMATFTGSYVGVNEINRAKEFFLNEIGGKVLNKPVDLVVVDDEGKPAVGARKVRELIESKGAKYFAGPASSAVGMAVSQVAKETKSIFVASIGADELTGNQCHRYAFRWALSAYGATHQTIVPLIKKFPAAKRWYTITPDYIFGHSLLNNAKDIFKKHGVEHVGNDMHPIGQTEYSSFFTKAMAAKADVVVFLNFGKDTINAVKQARNFGLGKKVMLLAVWSQGYQDLIEIGPEAADGVYFGCQFWHAADFPGTRAFVKAWQAKYKVPPSYPEALHYTHWKMMITAMEKAKSTDPDAVSKAMEGLKWEGLTGEEFVQPFNHETSKNYFLLVGKPKKEMKDVHDLASVVSFGKSLRTQAESDCRMQ
jgi:branched-chain amino acid transport system substrate-binding protein